MALTIRNSYVPATIFTTDSAVAPVHVSWASWVTINDNNSQTFTTTSQYRLHQVQLYLKSILGLASWVVSIFASVAGKPTGSALATARIVLGDIVEQNGAGFYTFTFSGANTIVLESGTTYAMVIVSEIGSPTDSRVGYSGDTPLAGNAFRSLDNGVTWDDFYLTNNPDGDTFNFPFKVLGADPQPGVAHTPSPISEVTNQPSDTTLSWGNGGNSTTIDLYFDKNNPPTTKVIDGGASSVTTYDPGTLDLDDEYFWRVDGTNPTGTTTGTVWSFETGGALAISNKAELQAIKDNLTADYFLTDDIDASGAWTPINNFKGVLDGRDFTVSNLTTTTGSNQGFFHGLGFSAEVYDLHFVDASIVATGGGAGIFAASIAGLAYVEGCTVAGSVLNSNGPAGGFAGQILNTSVVFDCAANATVSSAGTARDAGGFVGTAVSHTGITTKCFALGDAEAGGTASSAGGFIGSINAGSTIQDCYATGDSDAGGVFGNAGGFCGFIVGSGTIISSYSTGVPTGSSGEGGFLSAGFSSGQIITDCYYDSTTSGQSDTGNGTPTTTTNMMRLATFQNWDFSEETGVWNISEDISYPLFNIMPSDVTLTAPTDTDTGVSVSALLEWDVGSPWPAATYDVYMGTDPDDLGLVAEFVEETEYQVSGLADGTTYYWAVDSFDANGEVTGEQTFSFTTLGFLPPDFRFKSSIVGGGSDGGSGGGDIVTVRRLMACANNIIWIEDI